MQLGAASRGKRAREEVFECSNYPSCHCILSADGILNLQQTRTLTALSKCGAEELRRRISSFVREIKRLKPELTRVQGEMTRAQDKKNEENRLRDELEQLELEEREVSAYPRPLLKILLGQVSLSEQKQREQECDRLYEERMTLEGELHARYGDGSYYHLAVRRLSGLQEHIQALERAMVLARKALRTKEIKAAAKNKQKRRYNAKAALAAAHLSKTRDFAETIKRQLSVPDMCPYCQQPIKDNRHADHIYPVSRGGLSVPENMVNICSACNSKKGDMTLRAFIKKYKLDSKRIEQVLESLGKSF